MTISKEKVLEILNEKSYKIFDGKEKEFEEYVSENLNEICAGIGLPSIKKIMRQKRFDLDSFAIIPDIIAIHEDNTYSVFEIKCVNMKYPSTSANEQCRAIGQILLYKSALTEIYGGISPRMFLVDQKISSKAVCVFSEMKLPITLMEINNDRVFIPYSWHES